MKTIKSRTEYRKILREIESLKRKGGCASRIEDLLDAIELFECNLQVHLELNQKTCRDTKDTPEGFCVGRIEGSNR